MKLHRLILSIIVLSLGPSCWGQVGPGMSSKTTDSSARTAGVEKAVALLCKQSDITRLKDGRLSGCKTCPVGTDFRGTGTDHWTSDGITFGHFTSATADNLLVGGTGCDAHASSWGGTFVFTFTAGQAKLVRYDQGLITYSCHKFTFSGGRDFLVCRAGWTGQGENVSSVVFASLAATGKDTQDIPFSTTDTGANCGDPSDTKVRITSIQDIQFASNPSGGLTGMTITADLGDITCSVVLAKRAQGVLPPGVKVYKVEFLFDGKKFHVAPASKTIADRFAEAENL